MQANGTPSLDAVLEACLSADRAVRSSGEVALKAATRRSTAVLALLERLAGAPRAEVRQLAAQQLRKCVARFWRRLDPQAREATQAALLSAIAAEQAAPVRREAAAAAAAAARLAVPAGQWPQLLPWLGSLAHSARAEDRETALVLFCSLTDTIGEHLRPHFAALKAVCAAGLADGNARVRSAALAAVAALVQWATDEPEVRLFRDLVPALLQMAAAGLAAGDEAAAVGACEIFAELVEAPAPVLGPALPELVRWAMSVAGNGALELGTREAAMQVVEWVARFKPKQFARAGLVRPVVEALCLMCAEPDPPGHSADDDTLPPAKIASQALDELALSLPAKQVLPGVLDFAARAASAPEPHARMAACTVVVCVAEGCAEAVRRHMADVLQVVAAGLRDGEARVRGQAAFALGQLAAHCQPEAGRAAREALPAVVGLMRDADATVQQQACYALEALCEHMEEEVAEFLEPLMGHLGAVLAGGGPDTQHSAISAVASAAEAAGAAFAPYVPGVLPHLRRYMDLTQVEMLACRARATEAIGVVAAAAPIPEVKAMLPDIMSAAFQGLTLDDSELREYTHGLFGHVARMLGPGFEPYLRPAVAAAIESCAQDDGRVGDSSDESDEADSRSRSLHSDSDTDAGGSDDEDGAGEQRLSIRTAVLDEKAAASQALGIYAAEARAAFAPYIEEALATLIAMANYFHDDVRCQAYSSLAHLVPATAAAFPAGPGGAVSQQTQHVVDKVMPVFLRGVEGELDKEAASLALTSAAETLRAVGAHSAGQYIQGLCDATAVVAGGKARCQQVDDSGGEEADEGDGDEEGDDESLVVAACEAMPILAQAMGAEAYAPVFAAQHAEPLLRFLRASQPTDVRSSAVGTLADLAREMGPAVAALAPRIAPVLLRELRAEDPVNRRNAAFAAGVWAQAAPGAFAAQLPAMLQALHPLFGAGEEAGVRDNAAGAVGRLLGVFGGAAPLEAVVPVLLGALPLTEDTAEAEAIYGAMAALALAPDTAPRLAAVRPALQQALAAAAVQADLPDEVRRQAAAAAAQLRA
ncbi:hypothetical protein WJX81_002836 [Elliptochloris bilobata]|uniref:Importin N-terminal domain-containing protein n=1 Tax=Elliptochloris bilobata TaxID=381761 RepID=A0AAW1R406_9CHLO